jgi:hypothetical protein
VAEHLLLQLRQFDGLGGGKALGTFPIDQVAASLVLRVGPGFVSIRRRSRRGDDPGDGLAVDFEDRAGWIERHREEESAHGFVEAVQIHVGHHGSQARVWLPTIILPERAVRVERVNQAASQSR